MTPASLPLGSTTAEAAVLLDPMLDLERRTSAWWFERWTPAPARQRPDETFPRGVREQEWGAWSSEAHRAWRRRS
jgi:hypothetical protein